MNLCGFTLDDLQNEFGEKERNQELKSERKGEVKEKHHVLEVKKMKSKEEERSRKKKKDKRKRNFDSKLEERSTNVTTKSTTMHPEKNKWMDSIVGVISEKPISTRKLNDTSVSSCEEEDETFALVVSESLYNNKPPPNVTTPPSYISSSTENSSIKDTSSSSPIRHTTRPIQNKSWKKNVRYLVLILLGIYALRTIMNVALITREGKKHNDLRIELEMEERKIKHQQEAVQDSV